jgi:N-succinyldiaminopimelate aminotransferase
VTTSIPADPLVARMRPFGTTIFTEMSALAVRTGSINLGQGFPDTDGPPEMLAAAADALRTGANQYPPLAGIPALRQAIVAHEERFRGLIRDPDTEVVVTAGATEAIAAAILGLCEPGDEVVCFEPYYDSYAASIALAGAVRRPVTLRPGPDGSCGRRSPRAPAWCCSTHRTTRPARSSPPTSSGSSRRSARSTTCTR